MITIPNIHKYIICSLAFYDPLHFILWTLLSTNMPNKNKIFINGNQNAIRLFKSYLINILSFSKNTKNGNLMI